MRYLITGGSGFIGSALVRALATSGEDVVVLDDASRGKHSRLQGLGGRVQVFDGDIRDPLAVREAARGVDRVVHLAAINGTRFFYERPGDVLDVGIKGMINVLDACRAEGISDLAIASSSEVYQTPPRIPTDESAPLVIPDAKNPRYSYAASKIASEMLALHVGGAFLERVVIFRPHNVFGPDMGWEHVIPELAVRIARGRALAGAGRIPLSIQGDGRQTRAFVFIEDFVAGLQRVLDAGAHGETYHIGTMEEVSIAGVAHKVAAALGTDVELIPGKAPAGATDRRCPDTRKLAALGWRPSYSFDQGLKATVDWYAANLDKAPPLPTDVNR